MGHDEGKSWAAAWAKAVGEQIQRVRKGRGITVQRLSQLCSELRYPIPRSTLTNLETGRKESVVVQEVVVLAQALGVPAVELLFPGLPDGPFEYLPGQTATAWEALEQFTGETAGRIPGPLDKESHLDLMRSVAYHTNDLRELERKIQESEPGPGRETYVQLLKSTERQIQTARWALKAFGYTITDGEGAGDE
ncbi:helix-turn-helix domain-containing protein [Rhodococcus ruber]|uniref:helix-turn-helix domain-containing protein n=1 Tax=Rhodococcus ruber TaxID=1830 RepID=UPI00265DB6EE|nr:helix-turn-helix transcriptional regulator [Rhodococcus ruber]MDO1482052.1 helix-turn-helix transcriptional regulator [Rhodococcus ruber]